jgi:hypothetical protein
MHTLSFFTNNLLIIYYHSNSCNIQIKAIHSTNNFVTFKSKQFIQIKVIHSNQSNSNGLIGVCVARKCRPGTTPSGDSRAPDGRIGCQAMARWRLEGPDASCYWRRLLQGRVVGGGLKAWAWGIGRRRRLPEAAPGSGGGGRGCSATTSVSNELKWRRKQERKGNTRFPNPTYRTCQPFTPYICRFSHVTDEYMPRIFVGDVAPPMIIWGQSKSNRITHIFIGARSKLTNITLNSSVSEPTNIIWIYLSVPTNEWRFPVMRVVTPLVSLLQLQCIYSTLNLYLQWIQGIQVWLSLKFKIKVFIFISNQAFCITFVNSTFWHEIMAK